MQRSGVRSPRRPPTNLYIVNNLQPHWRARARPGKLRRAVVVQRRRRPRPGRDPCSMCALGSAGRAGYTTRRSTGAGAASARRAPSAPCDEVETCCFAAGCVGAAVRLTIGALTMRELDGRRVLSRVKGRPALEKRQRGLLVSIHRFGRARAVTRAELAWAARMIENRGACRFGPRGTDHP